MIIHSAYFVSDLHLKQNDQRNCAAFLHFLQHTAPKAEALYILGDLFDFWIGDDDLATPFHQTVADALAALASKGTQLFYTHGNRDFLIRARFAQACQLTLLPDPVTVIVANQPLLLSHGDLLCTRDTRYLRLRALLRHPLTQAVFLLLPKAWRRRIAAGIRGKSRYEASQKTADIMDVTEGAVQQSMQQYHATVLIHGHTHRPNKHVYPNGSTRWVLPDWLDGKGGYLVVDNTGMTLLDITGQPYSTRGADEALVAPPTPA